MNAVHALVGVVVVSDVWDGLREGFFMFWETLWALVLGFGLSGAVQAFVSKDAMQRVLGDHRAPAVTRSSLFGMASSSCSYAAAAMSRSLVRKGADFTTAMVFMFASTNLVIELGIVLIVLLGWQFAAAEFAGGFIMIVLLALFGGIAFNARFVARTRAVVGEDEDDGGHCEHHQHDHGAPAHSQITTARGWADAAGYAMADVRMLWKELLIGYTIAGLLSAIVPVHVWNDLFLQGHGFLTTLENVIIGPFIAIIAFVCSVGNVAMAAALWRGGIGFGGIISFIFADLIALPLLLVYRKYYGAASMRRMLVTFWVLMSTAGLAVEGIFQLFGAVPERTAVPEVMTTFHWNYTAVLNIAALVAAAVLLRLYSVTREPVST